MDPVALVSSNPKIAAGVLIASLVVPHAMALLPPGARKCLGPLQSILQLLAGNYRHAKNQP